MLYRRQPIELESPEEFGYGNIRYNLAESSVSDANIDDLDVDLTDMTLFYGDHLGNPALREVIAAGDNNIGPNHVLVTTGAALALFAVNTSLLRPGDHAVIVHPNYVTNVETPRAAGANPEYLDISFDENWRIDIERIEKMIRPETRLVSLTNPHNPTGAVMPEEDLLRVIDLVEKNDCYLLHDETYREMMFDKPLPIAALLSTRAISISSMSKSYGLPGIRIGWLICRDESLMETLLAAKEQIVICNSVIDEEIACRVLQERDTYMGKIHASIRKGLEIMTRWIEGQDIFEWIKPAGGVVAFVRFKPDVSVDIDAFYRILNEKYRTFTGPGHWFEMDRRYMRIGFGWPSHDDLQEGLLCLVKAAEEAML